MITGIVALTQEHSAVIGWIASITVFIAGSIWAFIARKSTYVHYGYFFGPQSLWMIILTWSLAIAGLTWHYWYITIPLVLIGLAIWHIRRHSLAKRACVQRQG